VHWLRRAVDVRAQEEPSHVLQFSATQYNARLFGEAPVPGIVYFRAPRTMALQGRVHQKRVGRVLCQLVIHYHRFYPIGSINVRWHERAVLHDNSLVHLVP
jgi:hypothetical protein